MTLIEKVHWFTRGQTANIFDDKKEYRKPLHSSGNAKTSREILKDINTLK